MRLTAASQAGQVAPWPRRPAVDVNERQREILANIQVPYLRVARLEKALDSAKAALSATVREELQGVDFAGAKAGSLVNVQTRREFDERRAADYLISLGVPEQTLMRDKVVPVIDRKVLEAHLKEREIPLTAFEDPHNILVSGQERHLKNAVLERYQAIDEWARGQASALLPIEDLVPPVPVPAVAAAPADAPGEAAAPNPEVTESMEAR